MELVIVLLLLAWLLFFHNKEERGIFTINLTDSAPPGTENKRAIVSALAAAASMISYCGSQWHPSTLAFACDRLLVIIIARGPCPPEPRDRPPPLKARAELLPPHTVSYDRISYQQAVGSICYHIIAEQSRKEEIRLHY